MERNKYNKIENNIINELYELINNSEHSIFAGVILISPELARQMLAIPKRRDRALSKLRVKQYAQKIIEGNWKIPPDAIAFDINGYRINGQHRLNAVILADVPVHFLVVVNMPEDSFMATDIGRKRTSGDIAKILSHDKNYNIVGSAASLVLKYREGSITDFNNVDRDKLISFMNNNYELDRAAEFGAKAKGICRPSVFAAAYFLCHDVAPEYADIFFNKLLDGSSLENNSPILLLRNRLIFNKADRAKIPHYDVLALIIKAWNYYRKNTTTKKLLWQSRKGESFPIPM